MKKTLSYFMVITTALSLCLASCSKDPSPAKDIAKEYKEAELVASNGGVKIANSSVTVTAINNTSAEVELKNIVNGQPVFTMNADVTEGDNTYLFKGTKSIDGMNVTLDGSVTDGKATVNVVVEITSTDILKTWSYNTVGTGNNKQMDAIAIDLKNKSGNVFMQSMGGKTIPVAEFNETVKTWGQLIAMMAFPDLQLTFAKDGYVGVKGTSQFSPAGQQNIDIPKLATYYYNPTTKMLVFDAPLDALLKSTGSPLAGTIQVPFICKLENGIMTATIDPSFVTPLLGIIPQGEALDALLGQLDAFFPPDFAFYAEIIKDLVKDVVVAITDKDVTSLSISAKLAPYVRPTN